MPWYAWVMIGWQAFAALATIGAIGKRRKPLTPTVAMLVLLISGLFITGIVALGLR